jgi:hypothetical protein
MAGPVRRRRTGTVLAVALPLVVLAAPQLLALVTPLPAAANGLKSLSAK